jgi:hypothetical protein
MVLARIARCYDIIFGVTIISLLSTDELFGYFLCYAEGTMPMRLQLDYVRLFSLLFESLSLLSSAYA